MKKELEGSCLCGAIEFTVEDKFTKFFLCHCTQCQQITGSSYASNVFTNPDNITWLKGKEQSIRYDDPKRNFTKVFCSKCGSGLPFVNKIGNHLIVPAGSLKQAPSITPQVNIFCSEQASWYKEGVSAKSVEEFPE